MNNTGLSTIGLLEALIAQVNEDAEDYNQLADKTESIHNSLLLSRNASDAMAEQVADLTRQLDAAKAELAQMPDAMAALEKLQSQLAQYRQLKEVAERKLVEAIARHKVEMSGLRGGDPKDKALIKRLQKEKKDLQDGNEALKSQLSKRAKATAEAVEKAKSAETFAAQMTFTTVYATDRELLMYFPKHVVGKIDGEPTDVQRSLLWMDRKSGRGGLITLDNDGIPVMGKAPSGGIKVSKGIEDFAGAWLRKVKAQGNVVTHEDFLALSTRTD
jgi:hypothetical protein